jgi:hypothetical protein
VRRRRHHSYVAQADDLIGETEGRFGKEDFVYLAEENVAGRGVMIINAMATDRYNAVRS